MKRAVLAVVVLGLALSAWVRHRYAVTVEVSPYDLAVRSLEENAREAHRIGATPVQIGALRAVIRPPSEGHAWFLYWGGNTSTYFKESLDTIEGLKLPPEIGVLVVAPPGYDGSEGHPSPDAVSAAALDALHWLVREQHASAIVSGGFSMGALSAELVAKEPPVVGTVLLASFTVFETGDPGRFIRLREPVRYRPPVDAPKVEALVLHGLSDDGFVPDMGREVAKWLGAEFHGVPDAGHVDLQTNAEALGAARQFILRKLTPAGVPAPTGSPEAAPE